MNLKGSADRRIFFFKSKRYIGIELNASPPSSLPHCTIFPKPIEEDIMELEIRAMSNIMVGQEITTNYLEDVNDMKGMNYKARQKTLLT